MKITQHVCQAMIQHARDCYPNEACGILAGEEGQPSGRFFPMRNLDESSISYFMDPGEQLKIFKMMREEGLQMTGIFHSHVASEATPSQKDIRLAFYPEVSYLIVSLSDMNKPILRSFKIKDENVTEEEIRKVNTH